MTIDPAIRGALTVDSPTALAARFEQLWEASGAPPLCGYEKVVVLILAATDDQLYERLSSVDLSDAASVDAAIQAFRRWRRQLALRRRREAAACPPGMNAVLVGEGPERQHRP